MRRCLAAITMSLCVAVAVGACATNSPHRTTTIPLKRVRTSGSLTLYSSLPLHADEGADLYHGIEFEMLESDSRAGSMAIKYDGLEDGSAGGHWRPSRTVEDATLAATDPGAGFYIGELNAAATALSAPIVAASGVAQLSPVAVKLGPARPSTLLTLSATAQAQSEDVSRLLAQDGCTRVAVSSAPGSGVRLSRLLAAAARAQHLSVVSDGNLGAVFVPGLLALTEPGPFSNSVQSMKVADSSALEIYASQLVSGSHANCLVVVGRDTQALAGIVKGLGHPRGVRIFALNGNCAGIDGQLAPSLKCMPAGLALSDYAGLGGFVRRYRRAYLSHVRRTPDAYVYYGYQAARLFVETASKLGAHAADRSALTAALVAANGQAVPVLVNFSFRRGRTLSIGFDGLQVSQNDDHVAVMSSPLDP